ncbi:transglycosylase SLT domain-containing protein [Aliiroseovarius crassostreae]|uniref:transglycosylase SLT domain-containing protein n=1 Tax=Aliiroseovarius crassostreae TaxID=154981 RepID=UPI003C7DAF7D
MTRNVDHPVQVEHRFRSVAVFLLVIVKLLFPQPALATEGDDSHVCDQIASLASAQTGVPLSVLKAISLTETGRTRGGKVRPWPWTVNMEGKGVWFDTEDEARAYVYKHFKRGARSFDVGCFQINYKWHHQNFSSLEEMFDPLANGLYAAKFLSELYQEKGNWKDAAGAYHSRTPKFANRYKERFAKHRATYANQDNQPIRVADTTASGSYPAHNSPPPGLLEPRVNNFPLLQLGQGQRGMGSLVPISGSSATPLFMQGKG